MNINNTTGVVASIEATMVLEKDTILEPDSEGFYTNIPLAVLGAPNRNNSYYEPNSFINCINSNKSLFNIRLKEGVLTGEYGHPSLMGLPDELAIERTLTIDPNKESHIFRSITVKNIPNIGLMVLGDLKPLGPKGKYLEEKLRDPTINCEFSLRSLSRDYKHPKGYTFKKVFKLVTFDGGIPGSGFRESSKNFKLQYLTNSNESIHSSNFSDSVIIKPNYISFPITLETLTSAFQNSEISMESVITKYEINQLFRFKKIICKNETIGYCTDKIVVPKNNPTGKIPINNTKSIFYQFFNLNK